MKKIASKWAFTKGLRDIGNGCYAYLQPDGSWGWSNAGLIVDSGQSMLVDTLFDLKLTREMLDSMRRAEPQATAKIGTLVNTHSNGDHCFGNELVAGAEIIASKACAEDLQHDGGAARLAEMQRNASQMGEVGKFFARIFAPFDFQGINVAMPTKTFQGELECRVGDKIVRLIEVGPAHTRGDVIAYVPKNRVVFTGDILFINGHPIIWAGPVANWINACQLMLDLDIETVVPGHGPITDKKGIAAVKGYLEYIAAEARKRYDAGMTIAEAAADISLDSYSSWSDAERIAVNVGSLYREFVAEKGTASSRTAGEGELFALMAQMADRPSH
ncbi:MAG: MBL fold metallo-hydrolase [Candidatus Binatus sp.]|uniref:MBL fold metallo-hydrolase n=1 Tax=Candidatus Binatus sp. TaxID=2811406 RepID=UPI0027211771|nr:MBL fold metallo-hydrolase [Candidatus Binatus sp.]MDO8433816.1 MBL fold metallo-hydrolase [Candidatus Binatus sp.]